MCRYVRVGVGVHGCWHMCTGMCRCVRICKGVREFMGVLGYACVWDNFQKLFRRIES